ncbi:porin [Aureimonas glaciei]|uniref:Porin n=1 Tax=Aureimonas glaciei TaxID=1776957 RepID=A0A916XWB9_9HYPH|nr:porin [Aureimonas glaciei]GGD16542.1 outer membrane protein [Aureimonas glaciei]
MNIKSILLGSAAALVAVSGARAADAVVMVEPEPVEYVRVCDVYGTGFFYIPGTETCLKIGGYVRMRFEAADEVEEGDFFDAQNLDGDEDYSFQTRVRARLNFDVREETELGTLRAYARVQATNRSTANTNGYGVGNSQYEMDQGFIQLGGLTMGKLDSLWAERDGLLTDNDWSVGDISQNRVSYTYAANGFSGALSLEDDGDGDFTPDVVGQLAYEGAWGSAYISGVYDEDAYSGSFYTTDAGLASFYFLDDYNINDASDGAFALKAGVELKDLLAAGSIFKVEGHYAFDPTEYASLEPGGYLGNANRLAIPSEWQVGAAYQQTFGKLTGTVSGVYGELFDTDLYLDSLDSGLPADVILGFDGGEYWGVAANVGYQLTSNFAVSGEVSYRDIDSSGLDDTDQTSGYVEFIRTF